MNWIMALLSKFVAETIYVFSPHIKVPEPALDPYLLIRDAMPPTSSKINYHRYAALMAAMDRGEEGIKEYDAQVKRSEAKKEKKEVQVRDLHAHSYHCKLRLCGRDGRKCKLKKRIGK